MPSLQISHGIIKDEILVVGLATSRGELIVESGEVDLDIPDLVDLLKDLGATGKSDEIIKIPGATTRLIVFTGLGEKRNSYAAETFRRAAGAAARSLAGSKSATFSIGAISEHEIAAVAEGAALGTYTFGAFKGSTKKDQKDGLSQITIIAGSAENEVLKRALTRAEIIATQTSLIRDLVNTPPSHLTPQTFTEAIQDAIKNSGVASSIKVSILNEKDLKKNGFGGITAVGQGSVNPPRLLHLSYTPKDAKKKYAYVGKGITFDTGGLALKPALGMEAMKSDMSGAAAVCAATIAIAQLKLPISIEAYAPLAENMVSDTATRPSDIISIFGGKTVEVLNPDAEGRLILADALVLAQEENKLDGIIDVATLTGAQVVALGTRTSAVMTNNERFSSHFIDLSRNTGESFWPMPLPTELRTSLDSPVADLANIGERMGGMLVAGLFLKEFISEQLPWLHLDIAGPAFNEGDPHGYTPVGGTGIAMRTLLALAENPLS